LIPRRCFVQLLCLRLASKARTRKFMIDVKQCNLKENVFILGICGTLVAQFVAMFVLGRFTREPSLGSKPVYLTSVFVLVCELIKIAICLMVELAKQGGVSRLLSVLRVEILKKDTLFLGLPSVCYIAQNNLVLVALSNLSAPFAMAIYQLKTIGAAFWSVVLLGKTFKLIQWVSFFTLVLGVVVVMDQEKSSSTMPLHANPLLGELAAVVASLTSGFASVFLEMMFHRPSAPGQSPASLWIRNIQLGLYAIPIQTLVVYQHDYDVVLRDGLFRGFQFSTLALVAIQGPGGLLVAVVIKYAGNMPKAFSTAIGVVLTTFISAYAFASFSPTTMFWVGVGIVTVSTLLYTTPTIAHFHTR